MTNQDFAIITDSSCDLTQQMANELELTVLPLTFQMDGREYANYLDERDMPFHSFYERIRAGEKSQTAAANIQNFTDTMRPFLDAGRDVLCLAFSSGLSNTYNAAQLAAQDLSEKYPDRKIFVVDTLCASLGQGLLCYHAVQQKRAGKSIDEVRDFAEQQKQHLCHWFTVNDLNHLKRGGRISAATALVGTVLGIKPVMHMDNEGRLSKVSTVRGRVQSLSALVDHMEKTAINPAEQTVFISHGDCLEDAQKVADMVRERLGVKKIFINYVGPVIGTHSGPGTVALFFLGTER